MSHRKHPTTVHHTLNANLSWGDVFNAPLIWDANDIPAIDPEFLKERGFK